MESIICSGPVKNKKQTYALLDERVPSTKNLSNEEIMAKLAKRYFISHGPATVQDFVWWSGIPLGEALKALENIKYGLVSEQLDSKTYWLDNSFQITDKYEDSAHFLPAYDEFIISYSDRSASLPIEVNKLTVSSNGLFRPVIVINGQVMGLWKRISGKDKFVIEASFFQPPNKKIKDLLKNAPETYGKFMGLKGELGFV